MMVMSCIVDFVDFHSSCFFPKSNSGALLRQQKVLFVIDLLVVFAVVVFILDNAVAPCQIGPYTFYNFNC